MPVNTLHVPSLGMHIDAIFGGIGRFAVKFRWLVVVVWVAGAVAAASLLPSLASVTQSNNTKFLPASAPSMRAAALAAPFGTANLQPIPVVAATSGTRLTAADSAALVRLQSQLKTVSGVVSVRDLGRSADGQAEQLVVLTRLAGSGNPNAEADLVDALRAKISSAGLPSGLQVHLAGDIAVQVDQQKQSGNTGSKVQALSVLFILVLLLLIFRALLAPFVTLIPAVFAVTIAGPLVGEAGEHGLTISPIAQLLLIVLVLGAGTDYGLFLVFRVREELRGGLAPKDAVVKSLTRVGESITFSAATVIAALLTLLAASFSFYSNLGVPLAIGIGVMLLAGLTLLPALLAIFGRAVFWPSRTRAGTGKAGVWGRIAGRIVRYPAPTLLAGLVVFGALAVAVSAYHAGGFGGDTSPPAGSDSAKGDALLAKHFPQSSANPTSIIFAFAAPVWDHPSELAQATVKLRATGLFTQISGPLNGGGVTLTPTEYAALHAKLGSPKALPPVPPAGSTVPPAVYEAYRATENYVSPAGRVIQISTGLKAGDPGGTPALNAVPAIRSATTAVGRSIGASASAVGGEAPALYDISNISNSDLVHVIPIAIVAIGLLLGLVLRSLVAPLYLIASVAISYLAALGLAVLLFIKIGGDSGLVFFLPFLMFIFLLALGEDYNILMMTRIREEARKLKLRDAVPRALSATGSTVTSAGLVLAGTFVVLTAVAGRGSGGSEVRDIGIGLALGILMDTFLVRTLLVPSTVILLGRWNWWPSRMSRAGAEAPDAQPLSREAEASAEGAAAPDRSR
jgi:putative drug exporter of the RND superfamily